MTIDDGARRSRRAFLGSAAGLAAVAAGSAAGAAKVPAPTPTPGAGPKSTTPATAATAATHDIEPFHGAHQAGIATPLQKHVYFAAFDLTTTRREDVVALLQSWTAAAARLTGGKPAQPLEQNLEAVGGHGNPGYAGGAIAAGALAGGALAGGAIAAGAVGYAATPATPISAAPPVPIVEPAIVAGDSGEAVGMAPWRLTLTVGFGAGLFTKDGVDRYGLAARRPEALIDLPKFPGDQLIEERTGGDLAVQACSDDPQVAFHAVRQLARLADEVARIRWVQSGFTPRSSAPESTKETPRNLMGFKDGTNNPSIHDPAALAKFVWVGAEGPDWMHGGSYLVGRRIRIALEHWDRMKVGFQQQTVGREKYSGAPLGRKHEFEPLDLDATDAEGNPVIAENAHVRLAAAASNDGAQILRRPYSYNDGVSFTAERWPPWRQGMEYDAGLLFLTYQRDPRTGFVKIYEKMSRFDMMNQFVTHVGGGLFACPGGVAPGEYIGQRLLG